MPYVGKKPADIIATSVDTDTGAFSGNVTAGGTLGVTGETTLATHLNLGDSDEIKLGAGVDLKVFSDGTNGVLRADNGRVYIQTDTGVNLTKTGNAETMLIATPDGAVELYHNNSKKLETTSGGVTVTGDIANASGDLTIDVASDLIIDVDDGRVFLKDGGTTFGRLANASTDFEIVSVVQDKDILFKGNDGGSEITALTLDMSDAGTAIFNNRIQGASASDGSPTYSFSTDTHTGMFSPANDQIGFSTGGTERMRLYNSTLSLIDTSFATARFCIATDIGSYTGIDIKTTTNRDNSYFIAFTNASGSNIGGITQNGTSGATFETSSDYRLKENVNYTFDATTRLKQLKPCRFNFIADGTDRVLDGFLAHEVSSIVPEAVTREKDATRNIGTIKDEDGNVLKTDAPEVQKEDGQTWEKTGTENVYQGIDQSKLVPLLTKALQEQQSTIEALTARIVTLENA